jgi:hypothetical protein
MKPLAEERMRLGQRVTMMATDNRLLTEEVERALLDVKREKAISNTLKSEKTVKDNLLATLRTDLKLTKRDLQKFHKSSIIKSSVSKLTAFSKQKSVTHGPSEEGSVGEVPPQRRLSIGFEVPQRRPSIGDGIPQRRPSVVGEVQRRRQSIVGESPRRRQSVVGENSPRRQSIVDESPRRRQSIVGDELPQRRQSIARSRRQSNEGSVGEVTQEAPSPAWTAQPASFSPRKHTSFGSFPRPPTAERAVNTKDII